MLSYQHIYHAGCFADVQKHALLVKTLAALKARYAALTILDTHAGRGIYDLSSEEALKTGEFRDGIAAAWDKDDGPIGDYLDIVRGLNKDGALVKYPGSAFIAKAMLRPADKLLLCELHPGEAGALESNLGPPVFRKDGIEAMNAELPPRNLRGLCVIDPSYEMKSDYAAVPKQIEKTWKKWRQGTLFLWYPILSSDVHRDMLTALRKTDIGNILVSEIRMNQPTAGGFAMTGSGVLIVNPPVAEMDVRAVTEHVAQVLNATGEVYWLSNRMIDPDTRMIL